MWQPPPRPEWVRELNAFGAQIASPSALVSLSVDSMLTSARDATGLDDFGNDQFQDDKFQIGQSSSARWQQALDRFVASLEVEANLHLVGRLLARNEIVRCLVGRLEVTAALAATPAVRDQTVESPVLVTGTGRSGTSLLHELLALDPAHRVGRTWELLHPCPAPDPATYGEDPRIAAADQEYTFWNRIAPEYQQMHENGGNLPNEDPILDMLSFTSDHLMGSYPVPSYRNWFFGLDPAPTFATHRVLLQLLQSGFSRPRWFLKSPSYLSKLRPFFAEYPDADVIITHRDPLKVLPSMTSLMATLQWMRTDRVDVEAIVGMVAHGNAMVFDLIDQWRTDGSLPNERIIDVGYQQLVDDPVGVVASVYERVGSTFTAESAARVGDYVAAKPRGRHGAHPYSFADTGLDVDRTRALYAEYMFRHQIPEEV